MPYVKRDQDGNLVAVAVESGDLAAEWLEPTAPELAAFLGKIAPADQFSRSDQELIRVIEDIVDTLIDKCLIRFTDLPVAAQQKLMARRSLRRSKDALDLMMAEQRAQPDLKL